MEKAHVVQFFIVNPSVASEALLIASRTFPNSTSDLKVTDAEHRMLQQAKIGLITKNLDGSKTIVRFLLKPIARRGRHHLSEFRKTSNSCE